MPATISIMNRHRQSVQRSVRPRRHGFALVVTVSLLVQLTLVALGLLGLSTVTLRSAVRTEATGTARANARLAMILSVGELSLLPEPVQGPDRIPPGVPQVRVPENVADFHLPVTSDPADGVAPVRMRIIDAGEGTLKAGRMLWPNSARNLVEGPQAHDPAGLQGGPRRAGRGTAGLSDRI
jgi:hypothetical protein